MHVSLKCPTVAYNIEKLFEFEYCMALYITLINLYLHNYSIV